MLVGERERWGEGGATGLTWSNSPVWSIAREIRVSCACGREREVGGGGNRTDVVQQPSLEHCKGDQGELCLWERERGGGGGQQD